MEKIGFLNPKPDYSIVPTREIPKYPLKAKEEIEFFIERISNKDYEAVMNRFYDEDFKKIFKKLFTEIKMDTGHLELMSNTFFFAIGVNTVFAIKPLFRKEEEYKISWDAMTITEKVQIFLRDFKERVKLIFGFDL